MSDLYYRYQALKEASCQVLNEDQNFNLLAEQVLMQVVLESIRRYQQKIKTGIEDSVSDLLDNFKLKVSELVFSQAKGWKVANRGEILFPKNCRFCYTKGNVTVVVIEHDPQVRTLTLSEDLFSDVQVLPDSNPSDQTIRVSLALPYGTFMLSFVENTFLMMRYGWHTSPLQSLEDMLYQPLLPNIHEGSQVCLGFVPNEKQTISQQCESTISDFWSSKFNSDLSTHWWNKSSVSNLLRTPEVWEENSISDPLFVLGLRYQPVRTLRESLLLMGEAEEAPTESDFRHKLSEQVDQCCSGFFSKINLYLKKTDFEKYHPTDVVNALKSSLKEACSELADVMLVVEHELDKLGNDLKPKPQIVEGGELWEEYSSSYSY